jgi:hypothetical protein
MFPILLRQPAKPVLKGSALFFGAPVDRMTDCILV